MQRVGSGLPNGSRVASPCPSTAFAEHNQVATLPVRLLRDNAAVATPCPSAAFAEHNQVATLPVRLLGVSEAASQNNFPVEGGFQMKVESYGFTPDELLVQVDRRCLMVTGQQQLEGCRPDGVGYRVAQRVHRQMQLPPDLDPAAISCSLTPSGQLCIQGQCRALPSSEA